jgi:uncharacterized protein (TIGR00299 family) protein
VTKVAFFNCQYGLSGDMLLASMIDAGLSLKELKNYLSALDITLPTIGIRTVKHLHLTGKRITVGVNRNEALRSYQDIVQLIKRSKLDDDVKDLSLKVFKTLGSVEAKMHKVALKDVTFHELGAIDTIVDIVGFVIGIKLLKIDQIFFGSIPVGTSNKVSSFTNPPAAVAKLAKDFVVHGLTVDGELATPTGVAILTVLGKQKLALPTFKLDLVGYGFGKNSYESHPNCVQLITGALNLNDEYVFGEIILLETNLDDVTGEVLAETASELLRAGALDCFVTPVIGKKGRPAYLLSVLCRPEDEKQLVNLVFKSTKTLGIRRLPQDRYEAKRYFKTINLDDKSIRLKVSPFGKKVEFEDLKALSSQKNMPLLSVKTQIEKDKRL